MAEGSPQVRTTESSAWLAGLMLGAINGVMLLALGRMGLALLAMTFLLIAWKGPRLIATAGVVTGAGLVWTVLISLTALGCAFSNPVVGGGCDAGELAPWIAAGAAVFLIGLAGSALALRRARRGR